MDTLVQDQLSRGHSQRWGGEEVYPDKELSWFFQLHICADWWERFWDLIWSRSNIADKASILGVLSQMTWQMPFKCYPFKCQ